MQEFEVISKHTTEEITELLKNYDIETNSYEDNIFIVPENQIEVACNILRWKGYKIKLLD